MVGFSYQIDDAQLHAGLRSLIALGRDTGPVMADITAIGESSTRMRFRTETGPDGQKWKPSLRARITGGRTLTKDGHLSGSISGRHGRDFAEWGVNRIYAAIHQFGGEIRAKDGSLRFRLANGGFATVQKVTMPARPFLGISDDDRDDILDIIQARIQARTQGGAHAG